MKKSIILGGLSLALFTAGLIFFANSGANNAVATEIKINSAKERPAICQQLINKGSCGCVADGGACNCGKNGGSGCQAAGSGMGVNAGTRAERQAACGCQRAAQQAAADQRQ